MFRRWGVLVATIVIVFALGCAAAQTTRADDRKVYVDCVLGDYKSKVDDMYHSRTVKGDRIPESEYKRGLAKAVELCTVPPPHHDDLGDMYKVEMCLVEMEDYTEAKLKDPGYSDNFTMNASSVIEDIGHISSIAMISYGRPDLVR